MAPEKRERLFQAARDEFAARGFSHASLNRIIGAVGMSKSSFYHYFQDKADLFRQTFSDAMSPVVALQRTIDIDTLSAPSLWPTLIEALTLGMQIARDKPEIITAGRMFYKSREDPEGAALTAEFLGVSSAWMSRLIKRGQEVGVFRDDLPDDLLIELLMSMGMTMDSWMVSRWDDLDAAEQTKLGLAGFDIARKILAPPGDG